MMEEQEALCWSVMVDDYVRRVHFAAAGREVMCTTSGGWLHTFSRADGHVLQQRKLHDGAIMASDVCPQQQLLATGGEDGKFLLLKLSTGQILYQFEAPGKWVELVAFSPDGLWVAFACHKKVRILSTQGQLYDTIERKDHVISALAWHQNSDVLAIGFFGGVLLYNLPGFETWQLLEWKNAVISLTVSPNQRFVCSGTQDCQVHIWPLPYEPGSDLIMSGFPNKVRHLSWHCQGMLLATNSGHTVVVWNFSGQGPAKQQPDILKGHFSPVTAMAFQHGGDLLVSGDEAGLLFFFCPTISSHSDFIVRVNGEVTSLCWSPNDNWVAVGTAHGELSLIENPYEFI
jgi:WD40 repeat protein